ncbi:hypothetical protein LCGC14_2139730 [marine sediment metagenome]|uniref:Uncharacterized protein n=1 Tax=marine sediment metagenome TaxID=412755 RepID=A0A0F9GV31_9ZZZZ
MANIGEITEVINATQVHLDLGLDRFILMQDLDFSIVRPESREATDAGAIYFYGQDQNEFTSTLVLSGPEISTFVGYTVIDVNGALPQNDFKIVYQPKTGSLITITVTCAVPKVEFLKPAEGGTMCNVTFRILEEVTAADIT